MTTPETQTETQIVMYTTTWCGDCRRAKRVFAALGMPYREVDIEDDQRAAELVRRLNGGMQSVPTLLLPHRARLVEPSRPARQARLQALTAHPPTHDANPGK